MVVAEVELVAEEEGLVVVAAVLVVVAVVAEELEVVVVSLLGSGSCSCNSNRIPHHQAGELEMPENSWPPE